MTADRAESLQAYAAVIGNAGEIFNAPPGAALPAPDVIEDALLHIGRDSVPQRLRGWGKGVACHEIKSRWTGMMGKVCHG